MVIGIPGSSLSYSLDRCLAPVLGSERNLEHAHGGDESARLSANDAYNHCFAPPLRLWLVNESSDFVRARPFYNDFAELQRACSPSSMFFVSQTGGRCMEQFAAFIAIDRSDAKHDICLADASTGK